MKTFNYLIVLTFSLFMISCEESDSGEKPTVYMVGDSTVKMARVMEPVAFGDGVIPSASFWTPLKLTCKIMHLAAPVAEPFRTKGYGNQLKIV